MKLVIIRRKKLIRQLNNIINWPTNDDDGVCFLITPIIYVLIMHFLA